MNRQEIEKFTGKADTIVTDAMKKIDENANGILFVVDDESRLIGCLTDGDVRRFLIGGGQLTGTIEGVYNTNPKVVDSDDTIHALEIMNKFVINVIPVLDRNRHIVDIICRGGNKDFKFSDALKDVPVVMMAGGKGTRLYPYTRILPKPLIPVGDIPIAEHIINEFRRYGCSDYYLVVNHKKNMIKAYFNEIEKDYNVSFVDEDVPLGTGGGLSLLKGQIDRTFILSNCDILIRESFANIYRHHKEMGNAITMICSLKNYRIPYGVVHFEKGGGIESMEEKPTFSFFTNTGVYVVEPWVLDEIPDNTPIGFPDIAMKLKSKGHEVGVYPVSENAWLDMGQMDSMEEMLEKLNL